MSFFLKDSHLLLSFRPLSLLEPSALVFVIRVSTTYNINFTLITITRALHFTCRTVAEFVNVLRDVVLRERSRIQSG